MNNQNLRKQNRVWILLNYLSLIAGMLLFYTVKIYHWPLPYLLLEIGIFAIFLTSLYQAYIKTKFWKMVHTSSKILDEREAQIVLQAIKYAYSIFTIMCLIIIYAFAIAEFHQIDVVLAGGLLYLAHILPASIVGWNEKYSASENN
jgi:hypothetical protein